MTALPAELLSPPESVAGLVTVRKGLLDALVAYVQAMDDWDNARTTEEIAAAAKHVDECREAIQDA